LLKYENQNGELLISNIKDETSNFKYNAHNNILLVGEELAPAVDSDEIVCNNQIIFGKYNSPTDQLLFSIGNGTIEKTSNIIEVSSTQLKVNGFIDCISPSFSTDIITNKTSSAAGVRRIMIGEDAPGQTKPEGVTVGDIYMWIASNEGTT
jgi:uncharacterized protein with WD repeat